MHPRHLALASAALLSLSSLVGCGDDGSGGSGGGGTGGGGGGSGGSGGAGGQNPGGEDHLLISELAVTPGSSEFIEIWNPTAAPVDLSTYYVSDNAAYYEIATGAPWAPEGTPGSDFLVQFPAGTTLAPDAVLVLTTSPAFETTFMRCADFSLVNSPVPCGMADTPPMLEPANGGLGTQGGGLFSNAAEMIVLFQWDGAAAVVKDVDYVTWGIGAGESERADKTGVEGYAVETARADQKAAAPPGDDQSLQRCGPELEPGEVTEGGNGITGHDETSEAMSTSFTVTPMRSPGVKNDCLSTL